MRQICKLGIWLMCLLVWSSPALASYERGLEAYRDKEYSKAYRILGKVAKSTKNRKDRARAMALMGAAATKMGQRSKARNLFNNARKLDRDVELPSVAARDTTVQRLFAAGRGGAGDNASRAGGATGDFTDLSNYYPFGINQYVRGKNLLAGALGGAQVLGLFMYMDRSKAASDANKDAEETIAEARAQNATDDPLFLEFLNSNEAFVKKANSEATLGLMITFAAYGLSVYDSLFDPLGLGQKRASLWPSSEERLASDMSFLNARPLEPSWDLDLLVLPQVTDGPLLLATFTSRF